MAHNERSTVRNGERTGYIPFGYEAWDNDDERHFFIDEFIAAIRARPDPELAWERASESVFRYRQSVEKLALCNTPVKSFSTWSEQAECNALLYSYVQTQLLKFPELVLVKVSYRLSECGPWITYGEVATTNAG